MRKRAAPQLRVAGFEDEWEELTLEDVSQRVSTKNVDGSVKETFTNSAQHGIITQLDYFDNSVSNSDNLAGYYVVEPNDFVYNPRISTSAPFGPINRNKLSRRGAMSPLYSVFRPSRIDYAFLEHFFKTGLWHEFMRINGNTGARHDRFAIGVDDFYRLNLARPSANEQRVVGLFFSQYDGLIDEHRRKHELLQQTKVGLTHRVFPRVGTDEPELRFKGFTGPWETSKFGSLTSVLRHNSLARSDLTKEDTGLYNVHYGDILVKFGAVIDPSIDDIPFVRASASAPLGDFLEDGDVVFADAAEDESVGKCSEIQNASGKAIVPGLHTIPVRPTVRFANGFLGYALNAESFHEQLVPLMQGSKVSSISASALSRCDFSFPSIPEQHAIGAVFRKLDDLIAAENLYINKLQQVKFGLLQEMFI